MLQNSEFHKITNLIDRIVLNLKCHRKEILTEMTYILKNTIKVMSLVFIIASCESNQLVTPMDCSTSGPSITLVDKSDTDCGAANGTVELSASGGQGILNFSANNLIATSEGVFTGLPAGSYTFIVTDEQSCQSEIVVSIRNIDGVSIDEVDVKGAGCDNNEGELIMTASGGLEPYTYKLDDGSFQTENTFTNLSSGNYTIHVKDDAGCEFSQEAQIVSGISLSANIAPIIASNCAISGCHNGNQFPDLRSNTAIISNANRIRIQTGNRSMPIGRTLSQTQIDQISCWVSDGAPNN